jgi:hypothetical protein
MEIYKTYEIRGSWLFENRSADLIFNDNDYYDNFFNDLTILLKILYARKLLIPKFLKQEQIEDIKIDFISIEETVNVIKQKEKGYLSIYGDTIIHTDSGDESYSRIFTIELMMFHQKQFTIQTKCDIWLPLAFDYDSYSFTWNLERYRLNYNRIESVLHEINNAFKWPENSINYYDHREMGCIQVGYKIFSSPQVITRHYEKFPNQDFDLGDYLNQIDQATKLIDNTRNLQ